MIIVNDKLGRIWKKAVMIYFKIISQDFSERTEEYLPRKISMRITHL
jgi:hypothetical protein